MTSAPTPIVKISKTFEVICCAHQLPHHKEKCARRHGHNYTITVWVKGHILSQPGRSNDGMLIDFGDLKAIVKPLLDKLDHKVIAAGDEPLYLGMNRVEQYNEAFTVGVRTTSECLAVWMWQMIAPTMPSNIELMGVIVSETPNTYAEYIAETKGTAPHSSVATTRPNTKPVARRASKRTATKTSARARQGSSKRSGRVSWSTYRRVTRLER